MNVILVTLDTTRADSLGCYGQPLDLTPAFDRTAREGVLFELAISTAAVTPVSHASILTGLDPYRHGLRVLSAGSGYRLPDDVPSLATVLAERGWRTGAVHSAFPVSGYFGFENGFEVFDSFDVEMRKSEDLHTWDVRRYQRRADETTDLAIDFLRSTKEPFFLWIHYWDPHDPMRMPPEAYMEGLPNPLRGRIGSFEGRYLAEVGYLDEQYGRLIAFLREQDLYDRTLIAVTSDHGEGLGEHDWQRHRILYQEQIHVPLILRVPGAPQGRRVPELVRTTDLFPTVLDYLGIAGPEEIDGRSLRPLLDGGSDPPRIAYADQINGYDLNAGLVRSRPIADFLYCVTDGRWKLIYRPNHPDRCELYDLENDPEEANNLYEREVDERRRLLLDLAGRNAWVTHAFPEVEKASESAQRILEGLGYTGSQESELPEESPWIWTCVDHEAVVLDAGGACPHCGEPLLLRGRR